MDDYWRTRFIDECVTSPTYRNACVLLRFCGMRPAELGLGVKVIRRKTVIELVIKGAKVRNTAGQPWRRFTLNVHDLPDWFVDDLALDAVAMVQVNSDSFRSYLQGLTSRVLLDAKRPDNSEILLSAYLFRHQLATDLRASRWKSEDIAKVLGEISADTVKHYGIRWPRSKNPKPVVAVQKASLQTARPVRAASQAGIAEARKATANKKQVRQRRRR